MKIKQAKQFKKQARMLQKRGANLLELRDAVVAITEKDQKRLSDFGDHPLQGRLSGSRELHVNGHGDWILRYKITNDSLVLYLLATGSHRDVLNIE